MNRSAKEYMHNIKSNLALLGKILVIDLVFIVIKDFNARPENAGYAMLILTLISFYFLYKLLTRGEKIIPSTGTFYQTVVINSVRDCFTDEERLVIVMRSQRMFEFFWCDFTSYAIRDKTLHLFKSNEQLMVKVEQQQIGKYYFQFIFSEVIERLKRVG